MAQTVALTNTLKKALKFHALTYADVADALDLSEASVKRLFAERSFSIQRLDRICALMQIEISDLVQMMSDEGTMLQELTDEQEQQLVDDPVLLLILLNLLNRWTAQEILDIYDITEPECVRRLAQLDRLGIIDLNPGNRVRLKIAANFRWRDNGPIQRFFFERVEQEFFSSRFDRKTEKLVVTNAVLSDESNAVFQRRLQRLSNEFVELASEDASLPLKERHGTTIVLAIRKWEYQTFENMKKKKVAQRDL